MATREQRPGCVTMAAQNNLVPQLDDKPVAEPDPDVLRRAKEIDPMAFIPHAYSMSDLQLKAVLSRRRERALAQAAMDLGKS